MSDQGSAFPPPAAPPSRASKGKLWFGAPRWVVIVTALILLGALGSALDKKKNDGTSSSSGGRTSSGHSVSYRLGGTSPSGDITYRTPAGTSQQSNYRPASGPLSFIMQRGDFFYVSYQNGSGAGTVTCDVIVDGSVVASNAASGPFSIVTCEGNV